MKKLFFLLSLFLFLSSYAWCEQWFVFCSYPAYMGSGNTFVALEKENSQTHKIEITDIYGSENFDDVNEDWQYLAKGTQNTFYTALTDSEWQSAITILHNWQRAYTRVFTDEEYVAFMMALIVAVSEITRPQPDITLPVPYIAQLKKGNVDRDAEGMISMSKTIVENQYAAVERSGNARKMKSDTLSSSFIWKVCFPRRYSDFDSADHLILPEAERTTERVELFTIHKYSSDGVQKAAVIFYKNYYFDEKKEECKGCSQIMSIARFVHKRNIWRLDNFIGDLNPATGADSAMGPTVSFVVKNSKNYLKASVAGIHAGDEEISYYDLDTFKEEKDE